MSGANGPGPVPAGSSPLAPLPPHHHNITPPRHPHRSATYDYPAGENYAPQTYGSSPLDGYASRGSPGYSGRPGTASAPPVPAKIPLASSSGGSYGTGQGSSRGAGGMDMTLMEEMQRIDIGTGRARRHGQGQRYGY
jgi:hypothetical protein